MGPNAPSLGAILESIYGPVRLQEALTNAIEDELDGQGRKEDAEDMGENVRFDLLKRGHSL